MAWRGWKWLWPWWHNPCPAEERDPALRLAAEQQDQLAKEVARLRALRDERNLYERRERAT